jgi:hypothetical protein
MVQAISAENNRTEIRIDADLTTLAPPLVPRGCSLRPRILTGSSPYYRKAIKLDEPGTNEAGVASKESAFFAGQE